MNIDYDAVTEILKKFISNEKVEILGISVGEERQVRDAIKNILTAYEKEKEKNKELEEKIIHRYKRICPECNNSFIAKRNDTKYCQKCGKKVARRKYKEANKEKIREYSKLHMRKYRAKKKLLKEE